MGFPISLNSAASYLNYASANQTLSYFRKPSLSPLTHLLSLQSPPNGNPFGMVQSISPLTWPSSSPLTSPLNSYLHPHAIASWMYLSTHPTHHHSSSATYMALHNNTYNPPSGIPYPLSYLI